MTELKEYLSVTTYGGAAYLSVRNAETPPLNATALHTLLGKLHKAAVELGRPYVDAADCEQWMAVGRAEVAPRVGLARSGTWAQAIAVVERHGAPWISRSRLLRQLHEAADATTEA